MEELNKLAAASEISRPDRDPDFAIECKDWMDEKERTVKYWVVENVREIIYHKNSALKSEINTNIDVLYMYKSTKNIVDSFGDVVEPEYTRFVEAYEHYLVEKELLS